ncbi:pentatricopeptide repeat-containing protein At2g33680 [Amborella trichopoda]|uniref:Pentacotripeptide-repeat region of PRORP domain-containing protein n=1 Tax=Amborella trichopoda TaxID=13333 RepID=U5D7T0_AMBTC|nr:pentatricopeptide repeat-containing protein At2g33680 [Amborella trichopoda]ERN18509.1 hypothetical protein AMTR_s00065p00031420 [Amborella trichopoda]|eukprot:XP_006857042.1 pentatricopeptide repeat-containing protein At2g33680 [Amborella trichopoda]
MITSSSPFHLCPLQAPNPSTSARPPLRTSQCGGRPCTPRLVATPDALGPSANISEANTCSATVTDQNYVNLLQECIAKGDLSLTTKLHHQILSSHVPLHARLGNTLLNTYTKLGDLESARQVFDEMTDRASLSWGIMMGAYLRNGEADVALELFKEMHREGIGRDHPVFVTALKSCGKLANMLDGQMVHCELVKLGLDMDSVVTSALLTMYADCGSVLEARRVFDGSTSMRSGTCVPWNAMVSGYSKNGLATESISLFVEMGVQGIQPDMYTFVSVLNTCSQLANKLMGMAVHGLVVKSGLSLDQSIVTSLIRMYAKCNCLDGTRKAFDRAKVLDITCWNSMIETYAQNGNSHSAIEALLEMQRLSGLKPNRMSFIYALNACSSPKAIELGIEIHNLAIQRKLELEVSVANALITMYAQCGNIEDAWRLFRRMPNKDIHSWNATIMGYAHRGYGKEALQIFEQMQKLGLQPDETTFVGLLVASSHVGDIERAHELLQLMRTCKISPTHFTMLAL